MRYDGAAAAYVDDDDGGPGQAGGTHKREHF